MARLAFAVGSVVADGLGLVVLLTNGPLAEAALMLFVGAGLARAARG